MTLVELMVVVIIVGFLLTAAVPALTGDKQQVEFNRFQRELHQSLMMARHEAAASRAQRAIRLLLAAGVPSINLEAVSGTTYGLRKRFNPRAEYVKVHGIRLCAAIPGGSCDITGASPVGEVRFSAVGDVRACAGAACNPARSSASIFYESENGQYRGRVVVYQSTGYIRTYEGW